MRRPSVRALGLLGVSWVLCGGCAAGRRDTLTDSPEGRPATVVTSDDIERTAGGDQQIVKALAGRVAGVVVATTPDGGIAVRIRGGSSIYGSNAPLYVVDGMPIEPGPNGALTGINPNDIESISVLKDAASMTMYGSRGANGVIIIRTKRANPKPPRDPPA